MTKTFLFVKQGDYLSLGSLPDREASYTPINPPSFFPPSSKGASMKVVDRFKEVPHAQEKIKKLKYLIDCQKGTVALWESEMPKYDLLPKVKEDLVRNKKLLAEITGTQPCQ